MKATAGPAEPMVERNDNLLVVEVDFDHQEEEAAKEAPTTTHDVQLVEVVQNVIAQMSDAGSLPEAENA